MLNHELILGNQQIILQRSDATQIFMLGEKPRQDLPNIVLKRKEFYPVVPVFGFGSLPNQQKLVYGVSQVQALFDQ